MTIIPLKGLKREAIAVEVHHLIDEWKIKNGELWILNGNVAHPIETLPPGEWKILGRANELGWDEIIQVLDDLWEWDNYALANNLTSELILIEQK